MKQEKIKKILDEQLVELSGLCEKAGHNFDKGPIHDFRLAVKAFRAFLRLLGIYSKGDKDLKIPESFKRLYTISGIIRDGQLELETIETKKLSFPEYARYLHETIKNCKDEWQKHYTSHILSEFRETVTGLKSGSLPSHVLSAYTSINMHTIRMLCHLEAPDDNEVHRMRKLAKDIIYTTNIVKGNWPSAYERLQKNPTEQLEQIASMIGKYNDDRIMLENIERFGSRPKQEDHWKAFCDGETRRLADEKKTILAAIGKVVNGFYADI